MQPMKREKRNSKTRFRYVLIEQCIKRKKKFKKMYHFNQRKIITKKKNQRKMWNEENNQNKNITFKYLFL